MRLKTWHTPRANAVKAGPVRVDHRVGTRPPRTRGTHKTNLVTLLSAVDSAPTRELAYVLELSAQYVGVMLGELELEGRVEKVRAGVWRLP